MRIFSFSSSVAARGLLAFALSAWAGPFSILFLQTPTENGTPGFSSEALSPSMAWMRHPWRHSAQAVREWVVARQEISVVAVRSDNGVPVRSTVRFLSAFSSAGVKRKLTEVLGESKREVRLRSPKLRDEDFDKFEIAYDFADGVKQGLVRFKSFGPYQAVYNRLRELRPSGSFKPLHPADHPYRRPFNREELTHFPSKTQALGRQTIRGSELANDFYFIPNKFPYMPYQFQITEAIPRPQVFLLFDTDAAFSVVRTSRDASLRVMGNGYGAGNTLNIIHQQGFFDQALPIEAWRDPTSALEIGGVSFAREKKNSGFGRTLFLSGRNASEVSTALSLSLDEGYAEATSANHLIYKTIDPHTGEVTFHAIVSFRDHVSDVPLEYPSRFAAAEMMGIAITTRREFFEALDPRVYRRALDAMSLPEKNFRRLTQRIRKEARAKGWAALRLDLSASSDLLSAFYQYLNPVDLFGFGEALTGLRRSDALDTIRALSHRHPDFVRSRLEGLRQGFPITVTPLTSRARRLPWISADESTDFKEEFNRALDHVLASLGTATWQPREQRSA